MYDGWTGLEIRSVGEVQMVVWEVGEVAERALRGYS